MGLGTGVRKVNEGFVSDFPVGDAQVWFRGQRKGSHRPPSAFDFFHITNDPEIAQSFCEYAESAGGGEILAFTLRPGLKQFEWSTESAQQVLGYPRAFADLVTDLGDPLLITDYLRMHRGGLEGCRTSEDACNALDDLIDDACLVEFDPGQYSEDEILSLCSFLDGMYRRFDTAGGRAHFMLSMFLQDVDRAVPSVDILRNASDEAIVWKVSALDKIVSGYEPLDLKTFRRVVELAGGGRLGVSLQDFVKAWEKCLKRSE